MGTNSSQCMAIQVHVPPVDGMGLTAKQKSKCVELAIKHLRTNNQSAYMALSGHGMRPCRSTLDMCDWVYWEDKVNPIAGTARMPAQYKYVHKAVANCKEKGFSHVLKLRGDGLYFIPNFFEYCKEQVGNEGKRMLVTQMTASCDYKMGDCIMFSDMDLMDYIWDGEKPVRANDGLVQTGINFVEYFSGSPVPPYSEETVLHDGMNWNQMIRKTCAFRNVPTLKWMDLRFNYWRLDKIGWEAVVEQVLSNCFDYLPFLWGRTNGWHVFEDNKMTYSIKPYYLEEESFYGENYENI